MPTVSVIIPCRDDGHFLTDAVESVHDQTFRDVEIIVVDDGSTDPRTVSVLERLEGPSTRVIRLAHQGVTRARNRGLGEATGRYLAFLDSDDRFHPDYLERTVARLETDATLGFALTWVGIFGDENWEWKPERCDFPWLLHDCSVPTASLVRRSIALEVGGFDESMELGHEDWNFWLSIVERGYRGTIIPEVLFFYRRAGDSRSTIIDRGATYIELYRDLLTRHEATYRKHLFELLWLKERAIEAQLTDLPKLEGTIDRILSADVERARSELAARLMIPGRP